MEKKRVIVTGGAGFIGSNLVHTLSINNVVVTVASEHEESSRTGTISNTIIDEICLLIAMSLSQLYMLFQDN